MSCRVIGYIKHPAYYNCPMLDIFIYLFIVHGHYAATAMCKSSRHNL